MIDPRLLAWARQAQTTLPRRQGRFLQRSRIPPLWLFTDTRRLPDPRPAVARLPRGLAGVVLRHDDDPNRAALGRDLARLCRARGLLLVVAGDVRLAAALRAGVHLRGGRWPGPVRGRGFLTSSAHGVPDLRRARQAGAQLAFLSPVFPTASHPGAPGLARCGGRVWPAGQDCRWPRWGACRRPAAAAAPAVCRAIGAIGALG